jgi:hypothetical protein
MIFSQSILSVVHADPTLTTDSLTQWGENNNQDQEVNTLSNDTGNRQDNPEAQQAIEQENQLSRDKTNTKTVQQSLPAGLEPGLPKPKESPLTSDSASVTNTSASASAEDKGLITVPSLEREAYGNQPSLMGGYLEDLLFLMRDTPPGLQILANESSSVEPTWGRVQGKVKESYNKI